MNKTMALITGLILIAIFGSLSFIFPDRAAPLGTILTAVVSLVGGYIGLQVVNNGVKGKCFNQALYDATNTKEG
jgi:uncharacterized membrane protein YbhN (UPF0104 family)